MTSWGEILVEWCNCLQVNPKIKDANELRESDFFKNISSILNKSDNLDKINQPFFHILTLLSSTYQHAHIEDINCDSFMEVPDDKLLILTSLLLHYTCIYDGREQFTLPLCQNLSKRSQLSIKDFLEKVNKDVTHSDLEKLIVQERVYEYGESKQTRPLTAVFRTPSLKRKFSFEKDRTVNKLKTALELEQYEKADVEEELKLQIKKTQKLERLLSKSNDEISALKSEIFKFKCQTPPQCSKSYDSEHKMRLMRKELENLEQYIENSEKEHNKLREEHHSYQVKIEEYEVEYANLRSKHVAYEEKIEELSKMLHEKSTKVTHLETYCNELNEILEGFRQQRPESTESSFSEYVHQTKMNTSYVNQDNLASQVIEIQLKETQEQIEHLNSRIALGEEAFKESTRKIETLQSALDFNLKKKSELENQLIIDKERYIQEIEHIKNERNNLCSELEISEKKNTEISNRVETLQESLDHLNLENRNHLEEMEKQTAKILELENIIYEFRIESEKLNSNLIYKDKEFEQLMTKYENSQRKLKQYVQFELNMKQHVIDIKTFHKKEYHEHTNLILKLKESIGLYTKKIAELEHSRDKLLLDLDEQKASNASLKSTQENLEKKLNEISYNLNEEKKRKEILIIKQSELENLLISEKEKYTQEIEQIRNKNNEICNELRISEKKYKDASNKIITLQETVQHLNSESDNKLQKIEKDCAKISELENIISNMRTELETSNSNLISKNVELEEANIKYENSLEKLGKYISFQQYMKQQATELEASNASLKSTQENLEKKLNEISYNLNEEKKRKEILIIKQSELENLLISEKEKYTQEIEQIRNKNNEICNELRICEKKYKDASNKIITLQETVQHLNSESDNKLQKIEKDCAKISELENIISNMRTELETSNSNLISKNVQFEEANMKYENSLEKLGKYISFQQYMKQHVVDLKAFHKNETRECNQLISNLKESLDIYDKKLSEFKEQREIMVIELEEKKKSNSSLLVDLKNLREEINKITSDWNEGKNQIEKMKNENQSLRDNFIGLTKTIKLFNDELNKTVKSLKERKNKSNKILTKMQVAYREVDTNDLLKTPEKSRNIDFSSEINILGEQISKLNVYIDIFSEKETFYLKEIESLKEEIAASNNNRFDVIQTLKEQILENDNQISSQTESLHTLVEKYNQLQSENQDYQNKIVKQQLEIVEVKKLHLDEIALKELHIDNLKEKIQGLDEEIINLKKIHSKKTEELLGKIVILQNQKSKDNEEIERFKTKIASLEAQVAIFKEDISHIKNKTSLTEEEYETNLANLQVQVVKNKLEITELKKKNEELTNEKQILSTQIIALKDEKDQEFKARKTAEDQLSDENKLNSDLKNEKNSLLKELESFKALQERCNEYEQDRTNKRFLEEKHIELSQKIDTLMKSSEMQKESYEIFKIYYRNFKDHLDKLLSQKNSMENLTNNLRIQIVSLNKYISFDNTKKHMEKKEALDVISEDIIKQYNRYSKQINDIVQELVRYYEKNCDNIFASLEVKIEDCFEKYNIPELSDQLSDLTERTVDILEQIRASQREFDSSCKEEEDKILQKENVLRTSRNINVEKMKEDDLKKKNLTLRQKITLLENTKSNLEKTVKKLREENKKLKENDNKNLGIENDSHYKILLQEYISYKEDQEKVLKEYKMRLEELQKEYEDHKDNCMRTSTPIGEVFFTQPEIDKSSEVELEKLKVAFSNIRIANEKLENENMFLKRVASEHKEEIGKFTSIKEAYDKLLEENNKLMTEVDTIKYKRARDKDEFLRWVKKERSENESKNTKMIQNIKAEYETKLEKMKDKMIKLYREEVNKEMSKIKGKHHESTSLVKTVEQLECDLFEAKQKIQLLMERDHQKRNQEYNNFPQTHGSNSQLHDLDTLSLKDFPLSCMNSTAIDFKPKTSISKFMEFKHPNKVNPSSLDTRRQYEERQVKTLPRTGTIVEEVNIRRKTSFGVPNSMGNLPMEDEEEMFNNKYLTDLKQGSCELPAAEGRDSRVSELAWRNSLVPPHLKSSYPAETQFCSPERFREDDIKCGGAFDDSSCKLLPNEKRKKDFGTTSYKKPGPPTPSKNGGRLSLTGNEMHVAKEQPSESKKSTPGRIRSLFSGRSSTRSSIEPGASPKKRLSIFRK